MRIFNFRTFLYTAITTIIGAFVCALYCFNIVLGALVMGALIVVNVVLAVFYYRHFKYVFAFILGAAALLCMLLICVFTVNDRYAEIDYDAQHSISGYVYTSSYEAGECAFTLENVTIDGNAYHGKIRIHADSTTQDKLEFLREGYAVNCSVKLYKVELFTDGFINSFAFDGDIRYTAYTDSESIAFTQADPTLLNGLHNGMKNMFTDFMGVHYGEIAYGMISGNREGLDTASSTNFGIAGIGHILAVSGLHVGFLIAVILFFLKRVSPKIKVPIAVAILFLYALFTGFSPSVMRAAIMSTVGLGTLLNGQRSDLLNNLSLSFTLLVATDPFSMFGASLLMSFAAVFGISCFRNIVYRLLIKVKLFKPLASAIAVSTSAQIGILPCLLFFFHSFPLYSILANIILAPLIFLAFVLLFITGFICLIFSNPVLLTVPQSILILLDNIACFIANLPFAQLRIYVSGFIFLLFPLYFLISNYTMLPKKKWILNLCSLGLCVLVCALSITPFGFSNVIIPVKSYADVTSVICKDNKVIVVGDCRNGKQIERTLSDRYLDKPDEIYLTSINDTTAEALIYLKDVGKLGTVYCPYSENMTGLVRLADNDVHIEIFDKSTVPNGLRAEYTGEVFVGYSVELAHEKKLLILGNDVNYSRIDTELLSDVAMIRCKLFTGQFDSRIFLTNFSVDGIDTEGKYVYCVYDDGEYIFDYESGNVYLPK